MARIVALSSWVSRGHVGLRALNPALEAFGHEVIALPTVVLSNHAAYPHVAGEKVPPEHLHSMVGALEANGWLAQADFVITGYLPSPEHVAFAGTLIRRVRVHNPKVQFVCDPVLGDTPKGLYIPSETAAWIRNKLVPLADLITPNAFELAWLTDRTVEDLSQARAAARCLAPATVLATSVPMADNRLATLLYDQGGAIFTAVERQAKVPSGTGDLLTGLFTAAIAAGQDARVALALSGALLKEAIAAAGASDDIDLARVLGPRLDVRPLKVEAAT